MVLQSSGWQNTEQEELVQTAIENIKNNGLCFLKSFQSHVSPDLLLAVLDSVGERFPYYYIETLLQELKTINWKTFTAGDLSSLFTILACTSKNSGIPLCHLGRLMHSMLQSNGRHLSAIDVATIVLALFNDGWTDSIDAVGLLLQSLLPDEWREKHAPALLCSILAQLISEGDLDLMQFHQLDSVEHDSSANSAIRLGQLLDSMGVRGIDVCARVISLYFTFYYDVNASSGLFLGRVLQQLSFAHEMSTVHIDNSIVSTGTRRSSGYDWRLELAIDMCCGLCMKFCSLNEPLNWKADAGQMAYSIGEVLFPLRNTWTVGDVKELVRALRSPDSFPSNCRPASLRLVLQILEGLGVNEDLFELNECSFG